MSPELPFKPENLKAASYEMRLGNEILYWDKDDKKQYKKELKKTDPIVFKKNSITYVGVEPKFFVPYYIALRFNLSITHVHRGLLLGTGPLIDPTFVEKIMIPIHNLTNNDYIVRPGDELIAVEFTKIWFNKEDNHHIDFDKMSRNVKKSDPSFSDYFKNALPVNIKSVQSSLEQTVEKAEQYVSKSEGHIQKIEKESIENIREIKSQAEKSRLILTSIGSIAAATLILTALAVFFQAKAVISDANNYVADTSNILQGNLAMAVDPKGFERAINVVEEKIAEQLSKAQKDSYLSIERRLSSIERRLAFLTEQISRQKNQSQQAQLALKSKIETINGELKAIGRQRVGDRNRVLHSESSQQR